MLIRYASVALFVVLAAPAAAVSLVPTCIAASGNVAIAGGGSDSGTGCGTMANFFVSGVDGQARAVEPPVTVEGASLRIQAFGFTPFGTLSGSVNATYTFDVPTLDPGDSIVLSLDAGLAASSGSLGPLSASVNGNAIDLSGLVVNGASLDVPLALGAGTHTLDLGLAGFAESVVAPGGAILALLNLDANLELVPAMVPEAGTALLLASVLVGLRARSNHPL